MPSLFVHIYAILPSDRTNDELVDVANSNENSPDYSDNVYLS